jgi:hypothetical protein
MPTDKTDAVFIRKTRFMGATPITAEQQERYPKGKNFSSFERYVEEETKLALGPQLAKECFARQVVKRLEDDSVIRPDVWVKKGARSRHHSAIIDAKYYASPGSKGVGRLEVKKILRDQKAFKTELAVLVLSSESKMQESAMDTAKLNGVLVCHEKPGHELSDDIRAILFKDAEEDEDDMPPVLLASESSSESESDSEEEEKKPVKKKTSAKAAARNAVKKKKAVLSDSDDDDDDSLAANSTDDDEFVIKTTIAKRKPQQVAAGPAAVKKAQKAEKPVATGSLMNMLKKNSGNKEPVAAAPAKVISKTVAEEKKPAPVPTPAKTVSKTVTEEKKPAPAPAPIAVAKPKKTVTIVVEEKREPEEKPRAIVRRPAAVARPPAPTPAPAPAVAEPGAGARPERIVDGVRQIWVESYMRSDGKQVKGYWRKAKNN